MSQVYTMFPLMLRMVQPTISLMQPWYPQCNSQRMRMLLRANDHLTHLIIVEFLFIITILSSFHFITSTLGC